jgi:hypothetical protein
MSVVFPTAIKSQGNVSVVVVQTMTTPSAPSLATDINGATAVNGSCYLYSGGAGTSNTNKGDAPRRLCSTSTFQQLGNTSYDVTDLQYVYDPQSASTVPANKLMAALAPGASVYLIIRKGLNAQTTAYAATQKVDVWHIKLGPQNFGMTGDGEFDELSITQSVVVLEPPLFGVAIVA